MLREKKILQAVHGGRWWYCWDLFGLVTIILVIIVASLSSLIYY